MTENNQDEQVYCCCFDNKTLRASCQDTQCWFFGTCRPGFVSHARIRYQSEAMV